MLFGNRSSTNKCIRPRTPTVFPDLALTGSSAATLKKLPGPYDSRIYSSGRKSLTVLTQVGLHGKLDYEDHAVEGRREPDVLHVLLQVHKAVLNGEAPVKSLRIVTHIIVSSIRIHGEVLASSGESHA